MSRGFTIDAATARILTLLNDPQAIHAASTNNLVHTLRRHDWVHRWKAILDALNLPLPLTIHRREEELQKMAERFEDTLQTGDQLKRSAG